MIKQEFFSANTSLYLLVDKVQEYIEKQGINDIISIQYFEGNNGYSRCILVYKK
jgi:hypothetical protein